MMQLLGIQYLRGFAAMLVVASHIGYLFPVFGSRFFQGGIGVDIFFVISGFIMWHTSDGQTPISFAVRRIIRIVPLYWAATLIYSLVDFSDGVDIRFFPSAEEFFKSLFFIAFEADFAGDRIVPIVGPGWTLNLEMMFYALFACALFLPPTLRFAGLAVGFVGVFALANVSDDPSVKFYGQTIIFEFLLGVVIAMTYRAGRIPNLPWLFPTTFVGFSVWLVFVAEWPQGRTMAIAFAATFLVVSALSFEPYFRAWPSRFLTWLGDASYSIYLSHKLVILVLFHATFHGLFPTQIWLAWPLLLGASLAAGYVSYRFFEEPSRVWLYSALRGRLSHEKK